MYSNKIYSFCSFILLLSLFFSCGNDDPNTIVEDVNTNDVIVEENTNSSEEGGGSSNQTTIKNLEAGVNELQIMQTISGEEVARKVYVRTPNNFVSGQIYPVLFAFHGAGGSGNSFVNNGKLSALIDAGEFIGVYPSGHSDSGGQGGFWNLGNENTSADDIEFVNLIIKELEGYTELDTVKRYALGFSNGAGMVNLLGKSTEHFRAIAPMFSQQIVSTAELIPPAIISIYQINGEEDGLIPIDGGVSAVGNFLSAEASALNWTEFFNCNPTLTASEDIWGQIQMKFFSYNSCDGQNEVKYGIALGTGHGFSDPQANDLSYEAIWEFFKIH